MQYKSISDPDNMAGANFSMTGLAFRKNARVEYRIPSDGGSLWLASSAEALGSRKSAVQSMARKALDYLCRGTVESLLPTYCQK